MLKREGPSNGKGMSSKSACKVPTHYLLPHYITVTISNSTGLISFSWEAHLNLLGQVGLTHPKVLLGFGGPVKKIRSGTTLPYEEALYRELGIAANAAC